MKDGKLLTEFEEKGEDMLWMPLTILDDNHIIRDMSDIDINNALSMLNTINAFETSYYRSWCHIFETVLLNRRLSKVLNIKRKLENKIH